MEFNSTPIEEPNRQDFSNVKRLRLGAGQTQLRTSEEGLYLGAERFADAPFRVDLNGNARANSIELGSGATFGGSLNNASGSFSGNLNNASGSFNGSLNNAGGSFNGSLNNASGSLSDTAQVPLPTVQSGTTVKTWNIGNSQVRIEGNEGRIIISDGSTDRVLIGRAVGLF